MVTFHHAHYSRLVVADTVGLQWCIATSEEYGDLVRRALEAVANFEAEHDPTSSAELRALRDEIHAAYERTLEEARKLHRK